MKKFLFNDYLTMICRLVFGGIFIYASIDKIANPEQFARIVYNFHILPGELVNLCALILPFSELIAGVCLIAGLFYTGSRNYLILIMLIFMIAIAINVFRGVNLECGCFTVSSKVKSAGLMLLFRDFIYLIPGIVLILSRSRRWVIF